MAVTCRKLSAPACCPAVASATTASWSTARNGVLAAGLLDGGAQRAEDVVDRPAAPARRASCATTCSSRSWRTSTSRRPTLTTRSQVPSSRSEAEQVSADESGGSGEQGSPHRVSLRTPLEPSYDGRQTRHGRADPPRHPSSGLVPGRDGGVPRRRPRRRGLHDRVGPHPVRRHVGDRGGLRGVRPGDARRRPVVREPRASSARPPGGGPTGTSTSAGSRCATS